MATTAAAAINRPTQAHPGPDGGNLHSRTHSSGPTSEQQDPGLHSINPDLGPSCHPQHHVSARPVYYVHAPPPPPPFLHYQWPMPFSYNPFAGFPGMGYGMVMPPFPPPPPYMEAPAYILPHPHIQPVDYRRLLHPQVPPSSAPYQNPNQTRRIRPPHTIRVRETVNSEVQTEPTHRGVSGYSEGSPLIGSDSGHGTASCSPSSSSSGSQTRGSAEVENNTVPTSKTKDLQDGSTCTSGTVKHSFNVLHPTGTKTVQACIRATLESQSPKDSVGQDNVPPCRNSHCNIWSVSSQDSMVPVCSSSQQEEEVVKERRISVPDILMSWGGGGTQQETMLKLAEKPENDHQVPSYETEAEHEKCVTQSPTETKNGPVVAESSYANDDVQGALTPKDIAIFKILKPREALTSLTKVYQRNNEPVELVSSLRHCLPYKDELQHSLNKSQTLPDNEQDNGNETNPYEDTTEIVPNQISLNGSKKKMNESVWSVESLPAFVPTKESQLHNSVFEPEVIIEMMEEAENGNETHLYEDTTEIIPYPTSLNSGQMKKKMNESVWSVESLPAFIPTKTWLLQNSTFEPEVIVEMMEEAESGGLPTQNDNSVVKSCKERRVRRSSSSDSVPSANRCLVFSTPDGKRSPPKKAECQSETEASEMRTPQHGQSMAPSERDLSASPTHLPSIILSTPTEKEVDGNRSSEPEANQSPNQESVIVQEQKSPCLSEQEKTVFLISGQGEEISSPGQLTVDMEAEDSACRNEEVSHLRKEQLCVPVADKQMNVSPSKGHLVDCGVQCNALQEINCTCKESRNSMGPSKRHPFKYPDVRKAHNGQAEGPDMKGQKKQRRNGHWRNRGQEKHGGQQEAYNGYCGKGGNGRNPRY